MSFSKSFCSKTPFKNVEKPAKPKISDAERTGISDKEHHAISSNTDAHSVMITVDKKGNRVEPSKKAPTKMKKAAMKLKKDSAMMMKKAAMKMKKASAMKMKAKSAAKMMKKK